MPETPGCQPDPLWFLDRGVLTGLAPLRGAGRSWGVGLRWCRSAPPPATRFDPSGIDRTASAASIDLATTETSEEPPLSTHARVRFGPVVWSGHLQTAEILCNSTGRINFDKSVATPFMRVTLDMNTPTRTVSLYLECGSVNPGVFGADCLPCNRDDSGLVEHDHRVRGRGCGLSRRLHLRRVHLRRAPRHNPCDNDI